MIIPQTVRLDGNSNLGDPEVLFVRKCVDCSNVFYIRSVDEDRCTKCGSKDTIIQTDNRG
jgi:rRNA maturation endonuclease Nob1